MLKRTVSLMLIAAILLCSMLTGVITAFAEVSENALDAAFESYLDAEGFPESYRPMLRELHAKYPNWKFKALKVNINFASVVSAEYILKDSLIDKSAPAAWKSYDEGRYNFDKSEFVTFDGGVYHAASYEYLAYCIDPRNFLTDTSVLMFFVAKGQIGETIAGINNVLSGLNWAKNYPGTDEVVYIYEDGTHDIVTPSDYPTVDEEEEETEQVKPILIGTIKGKSVNVRQKASTDSTVLCQLNSGDRVTVLGEENGTEVSGSTKWYKIKHGDEVGYVHSSLIDVTELPAENNTSSGGNSSENLPSDATSSDANSSGDTSSDNTSSDNTSSDNTSSDNTSSDNTSSDNTSSDNTSSDNTSSNSTSSDSISSEGTSSDTNTGFVPTKPVKEKIEINSYADAFYAAHKITGISAYMLASRIRQEQGLNGNPSGMGTVSGYEGYYNLWNIKTVGANKYVDGAKYAKEKGWNTPLKGIVGGSEWLDDNYFKTEQDTFYLQKYDVVDGGNGYYWHEYMTYLPAPWQEAKILKMAFNEETIQDEATFKIPIYNNMPAEPVACPKSTGTNNDYLKSISVAGNPISNFKVYTQTYTDIVIDYSEKVKIEAVPYDSGATVSGAGELELEEGINKIEIKVTASNGHERTYTVNVFMKEAPPPPPEDTSSDSTSSGDTSSDSTSSGDTSSGDTSSGDTSSDSTSSGNTSSTPTSSPTIGTTVYNLGDYLTGIEPETSVATFIERLAVTEGKVKVFGLDGVEKAADSLIVTGDKVVIYDLQDAEYLSLHAIIYGDVNADGKITSVDILLARRKILAMSELNEYQAVAANINKDANITSVDLLHIRRYLLGYTQSLQGE